MNIDSVDVARRFAAIMFTDVVGYSRMMQADEASALLLLEEHCLLVRGLLKNHGGHEIKTIGDAFLVEFTHAMQSVDCALEIQNTFFKRNSRVSRKRQILLRIGIHAGEVMIRAGDVYGDVVNIAARVETLAEPGDICITEAVVCELSKSNSKDDFAIFPLGNARLKNISETVKIFNVRENATSRIDSRRVRFLYKQQKTNGLFALLIILVGSIIWRTFFFTSNNISHEVAIDKQNFALDTVVVFFNNYSSYIDDRYISYDVFEAVRAELKTKGDIKVIPSSDVLPIEETARRHHAGLILKGEIRRSDSAYWVKIILINAISGRQKFLKNMAIQKVENLQIEIPPIALNAISLELLKKEEFFAVQGGYRSVPP